MTDDISIPSIPSILAKIQQGEGRASPITLEDWLNDLADPSSPVTAGIRDALPADETEREALLKQPIPKDILMTSLKPATILADGCTFEETLVKYIKEELPKKPDFRARWVAAANRIIEDGQRERQGAAQLR